jgi:catechol 2,3-dioxygenase-like lactoylglutathione lyase family enzyme
MADRVSVHIALNVSRFEESVTFYRAMFGVEPVKLKPGYAKFEIAEPSLNLTLNAGLVNEKGALNHLGIEVPRTAEVIAAKERLTKAGLVTADEMNIDCCFALQDKIWVSDPDGNRWEIFTVKIQDTKPELTADQSHDSPEQTCCHS